MTTAMTDWRSMVASAQANGGSGSNPTGNAIADQFYQIANNPALMVAYSHSQPQRLIDAGITPYNEQQIADYHAGKKPQGLDSLGMMKPAWNQNTTASIPQAWEPNKSQNPTPSWKSGGGLDMMGLPSLNRNVNSNNLNTTNTNLTNYNQNIPQTDQSLGLPALYPRRRADQSFNRGNNYFNMGSGNYQNRFA